MGDQGLADKRGSPRRLFLPSLVVSYFATSPLGILTGLLLVDMALSFEVSVGVMGQINTLSYVVAVIFSLFMGVLSVRFRHKSLLILGLLSISVSALGCAFASNLSLVLASYSLSGVGVAMVTPMAIAMVGEYLPLEKRSSAVGWIVAGGSLAYVVGAPLIALIAGLGGWRYPLFGFVIPILVAGLLLAFVGLPSQLGSRQLAASKEAYLGSFREVLLNRSAAACLVGNVLRMVAFMVILIYGTSFFRQRFLLSRDIASLIIIGAALSYTLGSLVSGRLVNRFGRKPLTVLTALWASAFTMSFTYVPNLWLSLTLNLLGAWFFGMVTSASSSLTLEQVPRFLGTMMSINSAALYFGSAFGAAVGGLVLLSFDYEGLGSILGVAGIVAALVFQFLAIDPHAKRPN